MVGCKLPNADVEEKKEEREEKQAVSYSQLRHKNQETL